MAFTSEYWWKISPLFISGIALIMALAFILMEEGEAFGYSILVFWGMLHVELCLPISSKIRKIVSATIISIGLPVTFLAIVASAIGSSFESGMPAWKGIFFFPAIILGPFLVLIGIRKFILSSCQKVEQKPVSDSSSLKFENRWSGKQ